MDLHLLFFILVILVIWYLYLTFHKECFNNKKPYIWMYWEDKVKGVERPNYLNLCLKTVYKHCSKDFTIKVLNEKSIHSYLPHLRKDLDRKLNINQKTDYYRIRLLEKYGGVWLDMDTLVISSLKPMLKKLKKYDFIGFGCHGEEKCTIEKYGYPYPANWVMISKKNTKFMKLCGQYQDKILDNISDRSNKYFELGRDTLWIIIKRLKKEGWDYYHYPSGCLERNSEGIKMKNNIMMSDIEIDPICRDKYIFVPIYNTAPGFPDWFKNMSEKKLLKENMLISKLFRLSLNN